MPLAVMVLLAAAELAGRRGGFSVPGAGPIVQHLTLWLGFLGAALAAREGKLLNLATSEYLPEGRVRRWAGVIAGAVGAAVAAVLAWASTRLVVLEREGGGELALGIPLWAAQVVLPVGLALVAMRLAWRADRHALGRAIAFAALAAGLLLAWRPGWVEGAPVWIGLAVVVGGTLAHLGHDVTLIDPWPEHVETIRNKGLELDGLTPEEQFTVTKAKTLHLTEVQSLAKTPVDVAFVSVK